MDVDPQEFDRATPRPMAPDPPNLKGTLLARGDRLLGMDLKTLDRFHHEADKDDA
jgi:hypothetical protein